MARLVINPATVPNDGTGNTIFVATKNCDANFIELYAGAGVLTFARDVSKYYSFNQGLEAAGAAQTNGTTAFTPVFVPRGVTITGLFANVTTLSIGGNFQLALYAVSSTTGKATGAPLVTTTSASTTVATTPTTATLNGGSLVSGGAANLVNGYYWFALQSDNGTAAFAAVSPTDPTVATLYGSTTASRVSSGAMIQGATTPQTFGTWSDVSAATFTDITTALAPIGGYFVTALL